MLLLVLEMCIRTKKYAKTKQQKVGFHCKIAQFR